MKGGTPKKRHISSTEKARLSSICASSGLIVSCCHCMSRSSNIGRPACNEPANFSCNRFSATPRCSAVRLSLVLRSEEHTSELQSLMRISYAVFCLKKKKTQHHTTLAYINTTYKQAYNLHPYTPNQPQPKIHK